MGPITIGGRPLRVLVVEDEALIAMQIEMALEDAGIEIVGTAQTADEAVQLAGSARPHLVTMDIRLRGDRDGVSAAQEIFETYGIRSIFVSAYTNSDTRARGDLARPLDWISKPFRHEDLIRRIAAATDEI